MLGVLTTCVRFRVCFLFFLDSRGVGRVGYCFTEIGVITPVKHMYFGP